MNGFQNGEGLQNFPEINEEFSITKNEIGNENIFRNISKGP